MSQIIHDAAKAILKEIPLFSRHVLKMPLRHYQIAPLQRVIDSILTGAGDEILIIFPRQAGKNEALAHLLAYLLNLFQRSGGTIVYGAIGDGLGRGQQRLKDRLDNPWNRKKHHDASKPTRTCLGHACVAFLSSHPGAYSRGETANILLVIDELQDQDQHHLDQVFQPMRAATNATATYLGTVKYTHDALWRKKNELEQLQAADGRQRVFLVGPDIVAAENPAYGRFLANQEAKLGANHPIIRSEYYLEPLDSDGGLFPTARQQLARGSHPRQRIPQPGAIYIATIDYGGIDESATNAIAALNSPGRDYTICYIHEIIPSEMPAFLTRDILANHGSPHFQSAPGSPSLAQRLISYLTTWQPIAIISDATGIGAGITDYLAAHIPYPVIPFTFTPKSKAALGSHYITLLETSRIHHFTEPPNAGILTDENHFFAQMAACAYELPANGNFDTHLRWYVPPTHTTRTPSGVIPTHDDRLIAHTLIAHADQLITAGKIRISQAHAAQIPAEDILAKPYTDNW